MEGDIVEARITAQLVLLQPVSYVPEKHCLLLLMLRELQRMLRQELLEGELLLPDGSANYGSNIHCVLAG